MLYAATGLVSKDEIDTFECRLEKLRQVVQVKDAEEMTGFSFSALMDSRSHLNSIISGNLTSCPSGVDRLFRYFFTGFLSCYWNNFSFLL